MLNSPYFRVLDGILEEPSLFTPSPISPILVFEPQEVKNFQFGFMVSSIRNK